MQSAPRAYAARSDTPDLTLDGAPKIVPLRAAPGFGVAAFDVNPLGMEVVGGDSKVAGTVTDLWVDRSEPQVRYLEVELSGKQRRVLVPIAFALVDGLRRRIKVRSIFTTPVRRRAGNARPGPGHAARGRPDQRLLRGRHAVRIARPARTLAMSEHEFEPVPGLPERLPDGERILWQGSPSPRALARRALHVRKVAVYFALLAAWHVYETLQGGANWPAALRGAAWLLVLGAACAGVLSLLGWAHGAQHAVHGDQRARRHAVRGRAADHDEPAFPGDRVGRHPAPRGRNGGPAAASSSTGEHVGYVVTWPHVRPWHFFRVQPTLRALPNGAEVAAILSAAVTAADPAAVRGATSAPGRDRATTARPGLSAAA